MHKTNSVAYGTIIYAYSHSCSVTTLMLLRFIKIQRTGMQTQYSFKLPQYRYCINPVSSFVTVMDGHQRETQNNRLRIC